MLSGTFITFVYVTLPVVVMGVPGVAEYVCAYDCHVKHIAISIKKIKVIFFMNS